VDTPVIQFERVGKKFCRSRPTALLYGAQDALRKAVGAGPAAGLRAEEFWALEDISLAAGRGECIGIIGPNGAGKSTLLKLANGDYRPDRGRLSVRGRVTSLIRLGTGFQPLLTGRENIYVRCTERGLAKREIDALVDGIVAFAGLEKSIDSPVKQYSDGMYARLEFAVATSLPLDILLVDEVLAVGDVAFQMRALERLESLKRAGTTILFVSHSEMNVRQIADRCLLLFDGRALAFGETDALFLTYYETLGFANRRLQPLGAAPERPADRKGSLILTAAEPRLREAGPIEPGQPLTLELRYSARGGKPPPDAALLLEFWSRSGLLLATFDSGRNGGLALDPGDEVLILELPFLGLAPGEYRLAGGFHKGGDWVGYTGELGHLTVADSAVSIYEGLFALQGRLGPADRGGA
jgi:ABC-type polysaccharide/polyol phosphate transport system ATPase subunit